MKFQVFVGVMLVLIVLLLGSLTGAVIYAGVRIGHESKNISGSVNTFTQNVNNINTNLQNINTQLQTDSRAATGL